MGNIIIIVIAVRILCRNTQLTPAWYHCSMTIFFSDLISDRLFFEILLHFSNFPKFMLYTSLYKTGRNIMPVIKDTRRPTVTEKA